MRFVRATSQSFNKFCDTVSSKVDGFVDVKKLKEQRKDFYKELLSIVGVFSVRFRQVCEHFEKSSINHIDL